MAKLIVILGLLLLFGTISCQDFSKLPDEQYHQMPMLFHMEPYERCISQRDHAYCEATFELSPAEGTRSQLYDIMKKYSDRRDHFNHTRLHRAVCLGSTAQCKITGPLNSSLEECIDKRMQSEYGFRAKLLSLSFCKRSGESRSMDGADIAFIVYLAIIIMLNISGTAYDLYKEDKSSVNPWLMAFSIKDNWKKLTTKTQGGDPRFTNLRSLNGIRGLAMFMVHLTHSAMVTMIAYVANPKFVEERPNSVETSIFANGPIIVQTSLIITNFLITYKLLVYAENAKVDLKLLPKLIVDRIARIVPLLMTTIALVATVSVYANDGPLWSKYVIAEANYCRATWWHHLLFINNFFPPACLAQTWSIAADFQLYIILSAILLWIISRRLSAERTLIYLFFASMAFVFVIAYSFELDPPVILNKPEDVYSLYVYSKSFIRLFQTFWGNLPSSILGVLTACIHYRLEKEKVDLSKNKMFVTLYQWSFLAAFVWTVSGTFLMQNVKSRAVISLYATIDKPVFALTMACLILGCCQNIDGTMKKIFDSPKWMIPSRLSFGMLLMHIVVNKIVALSRHGQATLNVTNIIGEWMLMWMLTFIVVIPLSLLVEYPFGNLYKAFNDLTKKDKLKTKIITNGNSNGNYVANGKSKEH